MPKEIQIIKIEDEKYPKLLKNIKNPPKQLYVIGNEKLLNENNFSIIGSRNCTEKGGKIAKEFAKELSKYNLCITSGMAKGIDSFAHIGALESNGKTIAVIGTGFNKIYPKENKKLFNQIIENDGLVITEYEENVGVLGERFIQRNRIVSGLSIGVLVIESKYRSGTSITANLAKAQGKKLFCIAHGIDDKSGVGTNKLIKEGAILVTEVNDILKEFNFLKLNYHLGAHCMHPNAGQKIKINEKYMPIYKILSDIPTNINDICKKTKINISEVNYILTMLELEEHIKQLPGKNFIKEG